MYIRTHDLERINLNSFLNCIKLYTRILHILFILIGNFIQFNWNNFILYLKNNEPEKRLELIKNITRRLEELNIVYIKIFQSLCLEKYILYDNEIDYLLKYTDNVPYKSEEVNYKLLDLIESKYNIRVEDSQPINSGIIGIVFKGVDSNTNDSKVVIKILKNDIEKKLNNAFNEIECLTNIFSYIPFLNNLNLHKLFLDNKESLLNQVNFIKEVNNIEIFKLKNKNSPEYRIPYVYKEITDTYNDVIVMENIKGLTINDIKDYDISIKEKLGYILIKFGLISSLFTSAIHCDLHAGNVFFYINNENSGLPKYQIGLIDFGLCCYPNANNQNYYYIFFYNFIYKKDFSNKEQFFNLVKVIVQEKEYFENLSLKEREKCLLNIEECITKFSDNIDITFIINLNKILKKYKLNFSSEFNQLSLSLNSCNTLGKELCNSIMNTQKKCIEELCQINKLIEI